MQEYVNERSDSALKGKTQMSTKESKPERDPAAFEPRITEAPWPTEDRTDGGVIILVPNSAPRGWPAMVSRKEDDDTDSKQ